jgi:hypothetical protein
MAGIQLRTLSLAANVLFVVRSLDSIVHGPSAVIHFEKDRGPRYVSDSSLFGGTTSGRHALLYHCQQEASGTYPPLARLVCGWPSSAGNQTKVKQSQNVSLDDRDSTP